jgi:hypothetical protein
MGIQFRGGNAEHDPEGVPTGDDALAKLRDLIARAEKSDLRKSDDLKKLVGEEGAATIERVQNRINELVDKMHEFLTARDNGRDTVPIMKEFIGLVQDTMIRYNAMEIGSIISTGMAGIATLEQYLGKKFNDPTNEN